MFKTSLGKLAIGVVALSTVAVAHAEHGVISKLKPAAIGVEGLPIGAHGRSFENASFFHPRSLENLGGTLDSQLLAELGAIKVRFSPSFSWLRGTLHTVTTQPQSDSGSGEGQKQEQPVMAQHSKVYGVLAEVVAATFSYDITHTLQGLLKIGGGALIPSNELYKQPHGVVSTTIGGLYRWLPNWSINLGGKYVHTFNENIHDVSGLSIGVKYHT